MKVSIEVKDKREASAVQRAMQEADVRAFVIINGILLELGSDRARQRVLRYAGEMFSDQGQSDTTALGRLHDGDTGE